MKSVQYKVLLADDDDNLRRVLEFQLSENGYEVISAKDGAEAFEIFINNDFSCLITDLKMPKIGGLELLEKVKKLNADIPVLVITAFGDVETAVSAMKLGAFDYITKPFNRDEILLTLERALNFSRTKVENKQLREVIGKTFRLENFIGESEKVGQLLQIVERVSRADVTVLIIGESGTGKELIAKGIHFSSPRKDKPFIAINCAAIPENLIESELFGYKRGSFSGALADTKGKFEEANGGTLFLDEISETSTALQAKLLRVLQEQEITRVGESNVRKIDVRIIASTNQDLNKLIKDGNFREDLYFRLAVVPIKLPSLRERPEDLPLLIQYFLQKSKLKQSQPDLQINREVLRILANYNFAGNVRELENLIERMVVLSDSKELTIYDLPENIKDPTQNIGAFDFELPSENFSLEELETEIIRKALEKHDGNQSKTARYLGITRSALIYRLENK